MNIRAQFTLIFLIGLFMGIVVESHVLERFRQSDQVSASAAPHSVGYRSGPPEIPASDAKKSEAPSIAGIPQISVDEPSFNFGDRDAGSLVEHTFTLKNQGKGTLLIDRVLTSCGCTTVDLASKSIPPGGAVDLLVKLDLRSQRGPQNRSVLVKSNDPSTPNLQMALVGNAIYHVALSPSHVTLDESKGGEPYTTTVSVRADKSMDAFNIEHTQTSGENVAAEVETLESGKHYAVKVKVTPDPSAKDFQGWVRLTTDHPGEYKLISIPISSPQQPGNSASGNASTPPPSMNGSSLDANIGGTLELEGKGLDGAPLNVTNYKGKLTAVIFWASTCGACRGELGELKQLHADYRDKGFEVLGVSLDKSLERRQEFLDELELPWETLVSKDDGTGIAYARRYKIRSIPSVVLLDRAGKIIAIDKRGQALRQAVSDSIKPSDGA